MSIQERNDANESLFFARDLEHQESKVYEKQYPAMRFRQLFPVNSDGGPAALFITYKMLDKTGIAQIISDYADDLPRVNASAIEVTKKVFGVGDSAVFSQRELDAAMATNTPLETTNLSTMREAYERRLEQIADSGDARSGLEGYNSNPNIPIVAPTTSAGAGDDTWPNKTADEILADFSLLFQTIITNSNGVHKATVAVLSPERLASLRLIRLSNTNATLASFVEQAYPGLALEEWNRMRTAGVGGVQRMSMMQRDPDVVEFREPMPFRIYPLERRGLKYFYNGEGRTAGVVIRYPMACAHMDGI